MYACTGVCMYTFRYMYICSCSFQFETQEDVMHTEKMLCNDDWSGLHNRSFSKLMLLVLASFSLSHKMSLIKNYVTLIAMDYNTKPLHNTNIIVRHYTHSSYCFLFILHQGQ